MTAAERIASFAQSLAFEDIPAEVAQSAKLHLLDTLGCGIAAYALGEGTAPRTVALQQGGVAEATVAGTRERVPAPAAALANATLCHALDFDDTHGGAGCHIGVVVAPAALAAGESSDASGRDVVTACVAGGETVARIGLAAPRAFHRRGFHPTSVCGVFGAAVVAARLSAMDVEGTANALGLAGSLPSGIFAYLDDGTPTKPIHPGLAAHGGLLAARLAEAGALGPRHVFEGRYGFYVAYADGEEQSIAEQVADLGERWETPRTAFKAYPACHAMHGCLAAAQELVADGVDPARVEEATVFLSAPDVPLVLEPLERKRAPRSTYEAKFSLPYSVASLLVDGSLTLASYREEALDRPPVLALARRVRYETRAYATPPAMNPGGVRLRLDDGRELTVDFAEPPGTSARPLATATVLDKFTANASLALPGAEVVALADAVLGLEEQLDLRAVVGPLSRLEAVR